jgi:hypothetical protein
MTYLREDFSMDMTMMRRINRQIRGIPEAAALDLQPFSKRATDADRDITLDALAWAHSAGALSLDVFQARKDAALAAVTTEQLETLTMDLPFRQQAAEEPVPHRRFFTAILLVITALSTANGITSAFYGAFRGSGVLAVNFTLSLLVCVMAVLASLDINGKL